MSSTVRTLSQHTARISSTASACSYIFSILAIVSLMTDTGGGPTASAMANADDSLTFASQGQKLAPTLWRPCPNNDRANAELDLVRRFDRAPGITAGGPTMPAGSSDLMCGTERYGYYHIVNRHYVEWTQKGVKSSENWRDVADYSIAEALKNPMAVAYRPSANTFCYSREVSLVNKVRGTIVEVMHPNVVVRAGDGAIITAFPSGKPCGS